MSRIIEKLTPEQEALMPKIRDEWIKIGLEVRGTNKEEAEAAINFAYECAGFQPPKQIIWFNNPVEAILSRLNRYENLGCWVSRTIFKSVEKAIDKGVSESVRNTVTQSVSNGVNESIWENIWKPIRESIENDVVERFLDTLDDVTLGALADAGSYGNLYYLIEEIKTNSELAFYAYFDAIGLECPELKGLLAIAKHCEWWCEFHEKTAFVICKPSAIRFDSGGKLHAEGEPAVSYEGYNFYFYHGVRIPAKYGQSHPKDWQVKWLVLESKKRVRQVLIEGIKLDRSEVDRISLEVNEELIALFLPYREKWRALALSTERINREKACKAIEYGYSLIPKPLPQIEFFDSPYDAGHAISKLQEKDKFECFISRLAVTLTARQGAKFESQIDPYFWGEMKSILRPILSDRFTQQTEPWDQLKTQLERQVDYPIWDNINIITQDYVYYHGSLAEFCITELQCDYMAERWTAFQEIVNNCGWIFPFENVCFVCDRPIKISLDNQQRLHAEGEPAIEFADGFSLYSYHGVTLPAKYQVHPEQWQAQWLLEENNAELRRVLIQGIGYSRLCSELQATELDSWQEYTLLKIDNYFDTELICLLKMICPSTERIHVMRVPPNLRSAREAIRWVNWGIDPEDFAVQT